MRSPSPAIRRTGSIALGVAIAMAATLIAPAAASGQQTTAVAAAAADATPFPAGTTRLYGATRYDTAVAISKRYQAGVPVAYVAAGTDFPDGLSAAAAAALEGGPLLLTYPNLLPASVRTELARLKPTEIRIVGGTGVVNASVESALRAIAPTSRIAGADRYATSLAILRSRFDTSDHAIIATGRGFADALSASGAAGSRGAPVLLVDGTRTSVPSIVVDELTTLGATSIGIAGGPGAVSAGIATQLANAGFAVTRYGGETRYDTTAAINDAYFEPGSAPAAMLANGLQFPDALAGAALGGLLHAPLYLTHPTCVHPPVGDGIDALGAPSTVALGGPAVVSDIAAAHNRCIYARTDEPLANWSTTGFTLSTTAALPYYDRPPVNVNDPSIQLDSTGLRIYRRLDNGVRADHPVAYAQYGISALLEYQRTGNAVWLNRAIRHGDRLIETRVDRSGAYWFPYRFPWTYDNRTLRTPWYSAMAQGQALSLFVRLGTATGDAKWSTAAAATWKSFPQAYSATLPWSSMATDRHLYFEEYAGNQPPLMVLNGHLFAMFGLYDYWRVTGDPEVGRYVDGGATTVVDRMMPMIRKPGDVSYYCVVFAYCQRSYWQNQNYHPIHSWQLDTTARITGDTRFTAWADLLRKDWQPRSTSLRSLVEDTEIFEAGPGLDEGWPAP